MCYNNYTVTLNREVNLQYRCCGKIAIKELKCLSGSVPIVNFIASNNYRVTTIVTKKSSSYGSELGTKLSYNFYCCDNQIASQSPLLFLLQPQIKIWNLCYMHT